jgi:hypothetical protein
MSDLIPETFKRKYQIPVCAGCVTQINLCTKMSFRRFLLVHSVGSWTGFGEMPSSDETLAENGPTSKNRHLAKPLPCGNNFIFTTSTYGMNNKRQKPPQTFFFCIILRQVYQPGNHLAAPNPSITIPVWW